MYPQIIIKDLLEETLWFRKRVFKVYKKISSDYCDKFNFAPFPTRIIKGDTVLKQKIKL